MSRPRWHRTKIVCTLGPATDAPGVLEAMVAAGMDVARINMSHGTHAEHTARIDAVRAIALRMDHPLAVLADLPGPKFRLGALERGARRLEAGSFVVLSDEARGEDVLPVRNRELLAALRPSEAVFLADGAVELSVVERSDRGVRCEVRIGGTVHSGSGLNVPDSELGEVVPTDDDRRHLAFALAQGVDWIGVSFVQSAADLVRVRACLDRGHEVLLMAKIEKRRALSGLEAIVEASDGVMVARGDLGVETDLAQIPLVQKRIIATANALARPVITATQMLESMIEHEHPTRAEVTDVANAVLDGTDAVMLSGETAIGRHPVASVEILDRVLRATEAEMLRRPQPTPAHALGAAATQLAGQLGARAIVAGVHDFRTAAALAATRPHSPLVMVCATPWLYRALALVRGVAPVHAPDAASAQACVNAARDWLYAQRLASAGDRIVLLFASAPEQLSADTLQIVALT